MENNDKTKQTVLSTASTNELSINAKELNSFKQAEMLVDYVAESSTFNKQFMKQVETEDGKTDYIVDKAAIMTCLILGNELGFSPMMSITFGKKLNREAVVKCKRGEAMGLSPMAAMENIYVFETKQREIVYTGIHVVNKVLTDAGVKREIVEDGTKPHVFYTYFGGSFKGQEVEITESNKDDYVITNMGLPANILKSKLDEGKIPVLLNRTKRALVKLIRGEETIAIPYTLQQAIDAELYQGIKSDGTECKGKANWNAHPETHLVKMSIMLGGRIIASDKLNGVYEEAEISIIKKQIIEDDSIEDVTYVETDK